MVNSPFGKQRLIYTDETIVEYLEAVGSQRDGTHKTARQRISLFPKFVKATYGATVDGLIEELKAKKQDAYKVLSKYASFCKSQKKSDDRIRKLVKQARMLIEFQGLELSDRMFRNTVKLPRRIRRIKTATNKAFIIELMQSSSDPALELCLLWHAATGRRPQEIFSIRHRDIDFKNKKFLVRGEFTKMGIEQERPMTEELVTRTEQFLKWKHRDRRIANREPGTGKTTWFTLHPKLRPNDLLFGIYRREETARDVSPDSLYDDYTHRLRRLLDRLGKGERVSEREAAPRKFSLYRLRDYVKTTVSDLGFSDYAEFLLGHQSSTYYNQSQEEQKKMFATIQPYITYLDVSGLSIATAETNSKVEALEEDRQDMRRQIKELREMVIKMQQDKYAKGEIVMEGVPEMVARGQKKKKA